MAVYSYMRVSTTRQANEGESLETQTRTIAGYAMMLGAAVDAVFMERGVSGSTPLSDRPEGKRLLGVLKTGDTIITAKLDRMFRSARDALDVLDSLKEKKISLHMIDLGGDVTGNGISKLVFTILSAVAEAERDRIIERIQTVKANQKARGMFLGGKVPFGWRRMAMSEEEQQKFLITGKRPAGKLEPVQIEQDAIVFIKNARNDGVTFQSIRDQLAETGIRLSLGVLHKIAA
jgi:putative DNA-invertase from lambdoid prophage Rac